MRYIRNDIKGFAVQQGPKALTSSQVDATSRTSYYLRELSPFFGTVTNQNQLDEMSKDMLKQFKDPLKYFSINLVAGIRPFDGYSMGDNIKIRIVRGRVNVDQFFRVVGMVVLIDNSGFEEVIPQLQKVRTA
jgi:hypothetical protein